MRLGLTCSLVIFVSTCTLLSAAEFVGISDEEFEAHYRSQQGQYLCWATCAEMVLSHQGIKLPANTIVENVQGQFSDSVGSYRDMIKSTNGIFQDDSDVDVVVSGQMVAGAPISTVLYTSLKNKKPIILLYQNGPQMGHAVVVTGAEFTVNKVLDEITVEKFHVFDPYCYRRVIDFKGNRLEEDDSLIKKEYSPKMSFNGALHIESGIVNAVIIIEGTKLK